MKKMVLFALCVAVLVGAVQAEHYSAGPYPNYDGMVHQTGAIVVPLVNTVIINDPFGGSYEVGGWGGQEFQVEWDQPLFAASYAEFDTPFHIKDSLLVLADIWSQNMDPGGSLPVPPLGGFNPIAPEVTPLPAGAPEGFYTGISGTNYPATVTTVTVADLPIMYPQYDTSMFVENMPGAIVYVAQATVPASDFVTELDCSGYFLIDSQQEWQEALDSAWPREFIRPMSPVEWDQYVMQWEDPCNTIEGVPYFVPYPDTEFLPPELYVFEGDESSEDPNDAGLVMKWGDDTTPDGNYASAWHYDYGQDPDLSNCIITVTVTAPQFGPSGQINQVSFSIVDINGLRRSWWWQVGAPASGAPIIWNVPTTVTIDTTLTGVGAATPVATGYLNTAGFDLTKAQAFDVDENGQWIFGQVQVPPPGSPTIPVGVWNYWHNLKVTPKLPGGSADSKWCIKYSQGPEEIDPGLINGWDERSDYRNGPVMADDWKCEDDRPITDIHWWGSFIGWTQPHLPPVLPKAFHIGIWTDVPVGAAGNAFSHPGMLLWENVCDTAVWNFAGYDLDPRDPCQAMENEACFQWAQFLSQDEWFRQEPMADGTPNIYWLSIAAIYDPCDYQKPDFYPWGWKTRPHVFQDDAVRVTDTDIWPITRPANYNGGNHVFLMEAGVEVSWDLAFELTTNEDIPTPPSADIDDSGLVDIVDFTILAGQWLTAGP